MALKRVFFASLAAFAVHAASAQAQNCSAYPYTLTNGTSADASQVMGNLNSIRTCANSNLAHNGANSDITSLNGLTAPITAAQGGTGSTGGATGDLSGFPNPNVVSTHLSSPLPVAQGGTGLASFSMTGGGEFTIASATTTNLGTSTSSAIVITGTTAIGSFGSSASTSNPYYFLRFAGSLTLTYNSTSMQLNTGGSNYITSAGDTAVAQYLGSGNWKVSIIPASGRPAIGPVPVLLYATNIALGTASFSYNFGTAYSSYEIVISSISPNTNTVQLYMNFLANGAVINGSGDYQWIETRYYNGGSAVDGSSSDTKFVPGGNTADWSSSYSANSLTVRVFPDLSPSPRDDATAEYSLNYLNTSSQVSVVRGSTYCTGNATNPISGIKFSFSSGSIEGGLVEIYGYP